MTVKWVFSRCPVKTVTIVSVCWSDWDNSTIQCFAWFNRESMCIGEDGLECVMVGESSEPITNSLYGQMMCEKEDGIH